MLWRGGHCEGRRQRMIYLLLQLPHLTGRFSARLIFGSSLPQRHVEKVCITSAHVYEVVGRSNYTVAIKFHQDYTPHKAWHGTLSNGIPHRIWQPYTIISDPNATSVWQPYLLPLPPFGRTVTMIHSIAHGSTYPQPALSPQWDLLRGSYSSIWTCYDYGSS